MTWSQLVNDKSEDKLLMQLVVASFKPVEMPITFAPHESVCLPHFDSYEKKKPLRLEHHDMADIFKLLFANDESVVSSSIFEDPANQNQKLTNPTTWQILDTNPSNTIETSENGNESIQGSQCVI